jgi:hypothetical protein
MDIIIIPVSETDWFFASPNLDEQRLAPLSIEGVRLTWRLWRDANLPDSLWDAATEYFVNLSNELNKPGRRIKRSAA